MYGRRLQQQQQQQQQNETILLPPCLLGSQSYSNTCKQCNYTGVSVTLTVNVTRSGVISQLGQNPLGFTAPGIAVTPEGSIVIVTSYSGPAQHPNSTLPAYPGEHKVWCWCMARCARQANSKIVMLMHSTEKLCYWQSAAELVMVCYVDIATLLPCCVNHKILMTSLLS
jgi:hypothetical protein